MTKDKAIEAINELPSEFELDDLIDRLKLIEKVGKRSRSWKDLIESVDGFSQDFMENRGQPEGQVRETFD